MTNEDLPKYCKDIHIKLSKVNESYVDGGQMYQEFLLMKDSFPEVLKEPPIALLEFLVAKGLEEIFPNLWIALRIFVTIPVSVASCERSFSKLKLIKTYLRSTMSQVK